MVAKPDNRPYVHVLSYLNGAIVCRSFLPFKISWLHLSGFVVELTNLSLCVVAIGINIKGFATVILEAV